MIANTSKSLVSHFRSAFVGDLHCANEPGTYHVLGDEPFHLPVLRTQPLYHNEERGDVLTQARWMRSSVCLAAILARKPRIEMQPAVGRHRRTTNDGERTAGQHFPHGCPCLSLTTPSSGKNERATLRMRNSQSHSLTTSHPPTRVKAASWNAAPPPQDNPTANFRVTSGLAKPAPPMDIGGRI